jgi:hypothetical protein
VNKKYSVYAYGTGIRALLHYVQGVEEEKEMQEEEEEEVQEEEEDEEEE